MRYRSKQTVEAWQIGSDTPAPNWVNDIQISMNDIRGIPIPTTAGLKFAKAGDWIVLDLHDYNIKIYSRRLFDKYFENFDPQK